MSEQACVEHQALTFADAAHLADFDKLSDMWENVQCENMVELRLLAPELVPRLKQPDAQARDTSHATFKRFACQDLLKVDMREPLDDQEYHVNRLVGAPFDCESAVLGLPSIADAKRHPQISSTRRGSSSSSVRSLMS